MADKVLGITSTMDLSDIMDGLNSLIEYLGQIPDSISTSIDIEGLDQVQTDADTAEVSLQDVQEAASATGTDLSNIDTSGLQDINTDANSAALGLDNAAEAANSTGQDVSNISGGGLGDLTNSANSAAGGLNSVSSSAAESSDRLGDASHASELLGDALSAVIAIGIAAYLTSAVDAAGDFTSSWERLGIAVGEGGTSISTVQDEWSSAISTMKSETGRGAGTIREFIIQAGLSSVTAKNVIEESFSGISGASFVTGNDIGTIENAFLRVVKTGTFSSRQLVTLGLSSQDVYKSTGLTVDEVSSKLETMNSTQRATFLSQILNAKYGESANEAYRNSWEHVKDSMGMAYDYLSRIIGGLLLPVVIPAMDTATTALNTLASAIDNTSGPIKTLLGVLVGGAASLAIFATAWTSLSKIIPLIGKLFAPITTVIRTVGGLFTTASVDMAAVAGAGTEVGEAAAFASAGMGGMEVASGGLLAAIGPVGWAIIAITAAVAAGIYIWQNYSEQVTNFVNAIKGGDWSGAAGMVKNAFQYVGQSIYNALKSALPAIMNFFSQLPGMIGSAATAWVNMGSQFINWLIQGFTSLADGLANYLNKMLTDAAPGMASGGKKAGKEGGKSLIDGIIDWITANGPKIVETLVKEITVLLPLIGKVGLLLMTILGMYILSGLEQLGGYISTGIMNALSGLGSAIQSAVMSALSYIASIPGQIWDYLSQIGGEAQKAGNDFVTNFINELTQLPGQLLTILWRGLTTVAWWSGYVIGYAIRTGIDFVNGIINFIINLPQNLLNLLNLVINTVITWGTNFVNQAHTAGVNFVNGLINFILTLPSRIHTYLIQVINNVISFAASARTHAVTAGHNILNGVIQFVTSLPGRLWGLLLQAASHIVSFGGTAYSHAVSAGHQIYNGIQNAITGLPGMVWNELMQIGSQIMNAGGELYNRAVQLGQQIWNGFKAGMGINSPGFMYWTVHGELGRITDALDKNQSTFNSGGQGLGSALSDGFEVNLLDIAGINLPDVSGISVAGVASSSSTTNSTSNTNAPVININAPVYGVDDLENTITNVLNKNTPKAW